MAPGTAPGRAKQSDRRINNTVWFEGFDLFNRQKTTRWTPGNDETLHLSGTHHTHLDTL
jgi:hypothetical protein